MGFFQAFKQVVGGAAEIKMLQNGSDIFLRNNTVIEVFELPKPAREMANEELKSYIQMRGTGTINEASAALFKLIIFYKHAQFARADGMMDIFSGAIKNIKDYHQHDLDSEISLNATAVAGV